EEDATPVRTQDVLRVQRIPDRRRVESGALVLDPDDQLVSFEQQVDVDLLARILRIAVLDRIGDRLADRQIDRVSGVLLDAELIERILEHDLDELDVLESATQIHMEPMIS